MTIVWDPLLIADCHLRTSAVTRNGPFHGETRSEHAMGISIKWKVKISETGVPRRAQAKQFSNRSYNWVILGDSTQAVPTSTTCWRFLRTGTTLYSSCVLACQRLESAVKDDCGVRPTDHQPTGILFHEEFQDLGLPSFHSWLVVLNV